MGCHLAATCHNSRIQQRDTTSAFSSASAAALEEAEKASDEADAKKEAADEAKADADDKKQVAVEKDVDAAKEALEEAKTSGVQGLTHFLSCL